MENRKKIILDTSALLYDAFAFKTFPKSDVYIPFSVLEEIDSFKKDFGEKGKKARQFNRTMDSLRTQGSLSQGLLLENKARLYVCMDNSPHPKLDLSKTDHRILSTALNLQKKDKNSSVELVSKDINLRIKADVLGIKAIDYDPKSLTDFEDLYTGIKTLNITKSQMDDFRNQKYLPIKKENTKHFYPNQYVILKQKEDKDMGRVNLETKKIQPILKPEGPVWGIHPRNKEQSFALDALMDKNLKLVSLVGKAGTGKTLLALACGLYKTLEDNHFQKLLVSRPVFPIGRDIGYLPGDIEQKLNPWMQPVFDSIDFLMGLSKKSSRLTQDLMREGQVSIEPLTYIRGRNITRQYLIVDEAQNLTPHEIKTILTRAGLGTKVILTGDCRQIDNPYVDSASNGLTFSVEKFKTEHLAGHITLSKGERSDLAEAAANIL